MGQKWKYRRKVHVMPKHLNIFYMHIYFSVKLNFNLFVETFLWTLHMFIQTKLHSMNSALHFSLYEENVSPVHPKIVGAM